MKNKLPYLNLGCGGHFDKRWTNIDFFKTGEGVIAHNLLKGIPSADNSFEVVYHSHVLEHFSKKDAIKFISECYRVLGNNGIIRIAVPDLEQIVHHYTRLLALGKANLGNPAIRADYEWIMTEMYDQTVRNNWGGEMLNILTSKDLPNEKFIYSRIGTEGRMIRESIITQQNPVTRKPGSIIKKALSLNSFKQLFFKIILGSDYQLYRIGKFRRSGEIHQWMYDSYSLTNLLTDAGFKNIEVKTFDTSAIANWRQYGLDEMDGKARKPDSLFVEAIKLS
ncbi:class I SAM-dependent methyltransferase [Mucilaginibacter boryungensis]|uniref:Methyltransferase domain-containing protein n=1 Tax=Mucilaginibacter boryungensis TaxID=768480 RepID=A0ABR9XF37_9SPHI|nr:methyltransferase domain-containing protein [Mucilaginibacter boryungensis]MBE9666002.1 methyltransferase domain-containing protein [Mucilaginibacter boryungensis]